VFTVNQQKDDYERFLTEESLLKSFKRMDSSDIMEIKRKIPKMYRS